LNFHSFFALHNQKLHAFHLKDSNSIELYHFPIHIYSSILKIFCPSCWANRVHTYR